ncbi:MAG: hypothetical protein LBD59_12725 [Prevotellaceae bacterium]|nr:hypothetical protein [Prevotellaceae bacterium]
MKRLFVITVMLMFALPCVQDVQGRNGRDKIIDCKFRGKKLYGRVRVVTAFADFRVREVTAFEDLRVQKVTAFPDACGKWEFVTAHEDFTVEFVTAHEDFTVRYVTEFPGTP